jgi:hypothetical protein
VATAMPVQGPRGAAAFADARLEWRRLVAECGGTFFLVLVAAGGGVVDALSHGQVGRAAAVTAPGLMVLAMIYISGRPPGRTSIPPSRSRSPRAATSPGGACPAMCAPNSPGP